MSIHGGYSSLSEGPAITQAVPVAQRTPVIPTEYGIPHMGDSSFSGVDGRIHDIPAMDAEDASILHPAHMRTDVPLMERYKQQAESPLPKKSTKTAKDDSMDSNAMDAEEDTPIEHHSALKARGFTHEGTYGGNAASSRKENFDHPSGENVMVHTHGSSRGKFAHTRIEGEKLKTNRGNNVNELESSLNSVKDRD